MPAHTWMMSSMMLMSRLPGMKPAPMPWILCGPGAPPEMTGLSVGSTAITCSARRSPHVLLSMQDKMAGHNGKACLMKCSHNSLIFRLGARCSERACLDLGILLLEVTSGARDCAARAHARHQHIDLPPQQRRCYSATHCICNVESSKYTALSAGRQCTWKL